jgi:hypothetical protein
MSTRAWEGAAVLLSSWDIWSSPHDGSQENSEDGITKATYEYRALTPDDQGETQPEEEEQNEDAGGHPLNHVDGADDRGPQDPGLPEPQVRMVPKFKILTENGCSRVIVPGKVHQDSSMAWKYFSDTERAFGTCCFAAVAGDERLRHFCSEHFLFLKCLGRLVGNSTRGYACAYCTQGGRGRWKEADQHAFLDHKFLNCPGRTRSIQYTLLVVTVADFWKDTLPLPEVTREGVFRQIADSSEGRGGPIKVTLPPRSVGVGQEIPDLVQFKTFCLVIWVP